ncbi:hypothetical protein ACFWZ2_08065 [Streptomyces sp. NPDC059002]|uniref:hypothetical protein n=1 Tax=Streptomyces sp. NPDC059002 TaxID=3346690 RepID=UPI0036BFE1FD
MSRSEALGVLCPGQSAVLGDPAKGVISGVVRYERLASLGEAVTLDEAAEPALLVPAHLTLEQAFHILLAHSEMSWLVSESGGLLARSELVPAPLERFAGATPDRGGLPGDPVSPASGLTYRCPAEPGAHVFPPSRIEVWTTDLRARCPVDGRLMTAFLPPADDQE